MSPIVEDGSNVNEPSSIFVKRYFYQVDLYSLKLSNWEEFLIVLMHIYRYVLLVIMYCMYRYIGKRASPCVWYVCKVRNILNVHYISLTNLSIYILRTDNLVVKSLFSFDLSIISLECNLILFQTVVYGIYFLRNCALLHKACFPTHEYFFEMKKLWSGLIT